MREQRIIGTIGIVMCVVLALLPQALALNDLMALQGVVDDSGQPIDGNLSITIWNQSVSGTKLYDSGTDFNNQIINGRFDIMLGEITELTLEYGEYYYMDMSVNGQDLDFSGSERQLFQSSSGSVRKTQVSSSGTWDESEVPSLSSSWPGTIDSSKIIGGDFTANNSLYLGGLTKDAFLINDSRLDEDINSINTTNNMRRLGFNTTAQLTTLYYLATNPSNFVTTTVNNLVNYYLKSEVYNKTESDVKYYSSSNPSSYIADGNSNWDNSYGFISGSFANNTYIRTGTSCQCSNTADRMYNFTVTANGLCTAVCGSDETGGNPSTEATYTMISTGVTMASNAVIMDLFNAVGSGKVIRIVEVSAYQRDTAAVTGLRVPVEITKTSAVGTGGTAISPGMFDSLDSSLPAQITARTAPSGGATVSGRVLGGSRLLTEEGSIGTGNAGSFPWLQSVSVLYANNGMSPRKRLSLQEGEGIQCKWGTVVGTAAGLGACAVTFQIGDSYTNELETYSWQSNSAATATKKMIDVFNAAGSGKILKITRVVIYAHPTGTVTGRVIPFEIFRTSAVGTGGTVITADKYDTTDADVPVQITARDAPTGGATLSGGVILATVVGTDETADSEYGGFGASTRGSNVQYIWDSSSSKRPLTVREGEGLVLQTGPLTGSGNVIIIVEGTLV